LTIKNASRMYDVRRRLSTAKTASPRVLALAMLAVPFPAACGSTGATGTTTAAGGHRATVGWADKGHTVRVSQGTRILLKLKNTYWEIQGSSAPDVVRQLGSERKTAPPQGSCLPGIGCGTVTASFQAVGPGTAHLRAHRSSCGEALACTGGQGRYDVVIRVSG
jgi:hypothetical protein